MPLPVESLTPNSTDSEIQTKISESIGKCMEEGGREQKECAGMVYDIARERTGKELNHGR